MENVCVCVCVCVLGSKEGILGEGWLSARQGAVGHILGKGRHV